MTSMATTSEGARTSAQAISSYLSDADSELDIDGNGELSALTDGLLIIRRLFGFEGDALINGALAPNAARTDAAAIASYIDGLKP